MQQVSHMVFAKFAPVSITDNCTGHLLAPAGPEGLTSSVHFSSGPRVGQLVLHSAHWPPLEVGRTIAALSARAVTVQTRRPYCYVRVCNGRVVCRPWRVHVCRASLRVSNNIRTGFFASSSSALSTSSVHWTLSDVVAEAFHPICAATLLWARKPRLLE